MKNYRIAVLGATGNVGSEVLSVLDTRKIPIAELFPLASDDFTKRQVFFRGKTLDVTDARKFDFKKVDIVIFVAGSKTSIEYREKVVEAGCIIIDSASAFRMEAGVPLVLPDVNTESLIGFREKNLIASPNCSTAQMAMALKPVHDKYGIKRIVASTYQSVSGAGKKAMDELYLRSKSFFEIAISGREVTERDQASVFTKDIAFNCIPHIDSFMEDGKTREEWKMEVETQKIFGSNVSVSATCVRVPVFVGHAISANVELEKPFVLEELEEEMSDFEGIVMVNGKKDGGYITQREVVRTFGVFVSRLRIDDTKPNCINMWIVADNVYGIGAAYNIVRILEELIKIL